MITTITTIMITKITKITMNGWIRTDGVLKDPRSVPYLRNPGEPYRIVTVPYSAVSPAGWRELISVEYQTVCAIVALVVGSTMYANMQEFVDATASHVVDVGMLEIDYSTLMSSG